MKNKKSGYEKVRYEIDPHNRLIAGKTGRKTGLHRFRQVLTGRFKIDKNRQLTYHVKSPGPRGANIPHQVKFKGKWSLTEDHNLRFTLDKWGRQTLGDKLTLQGEIMDVSKNSLLFAVSTRTKENVQSIYVLKLQGVWQADKHNRLTFRVKKEKGRHDILTFKGGWRLNKHYQIIYQYEKARLIRKQKKIHTLIFKGYWEIKDKARISYVIDRTSESVFGFKASLGLFKVDYIKYTVGISAVQKTEPIKRTVTLFGKWRIKRGTGLIFEYKNKKIHNIAFGAEVRLTSNDRICFKLTNDIDKKDLGVKLELSRRILKGDGRAFLHLLKSRQESAVFIGTGVRW